MSTIPTTPTSRWLRDRHPRLEVICGPMGSGKSGELIRRVTVAQLGKLTVRVFRPVLDTRAPAGVIASRNGLTTTAIGVANPMEMLDHVDETVDLVAIDEASLFDETLDDAVRALLLRGLWVIVAGLDLDFAARPFEAMARLLALADEVTKLTSICSVCHSLFATRTQRLIDGRPASADTPRLIVEHADRRVEYQARCVRCYVPPDTTAPRHPLRP